MPRPAARHRLFLVALLVVATLAGASALGFPYGRCVWFFVNGVLGPAGDVTPPLPQGCVITTERPPEALVHASDDERQRRGLLFDKMVSCRLPPGSSPASFPAENDPRWLPSYVCCAWQYRRHVVVAPSTQVPQPEPGLFFAYMCLVPRWKYAKQIGGKCDWRFEAWK